MILSVGCGHTDQGVAVNMGSTADTSSRVKAVTAQEPNSVVQAVDSTAMITLPFADTAARKLSKADTTKQELKPKPMKSKGTSLPDDGATRHFYKNKKLSVKIEPWNEEQNRVIHFYNNTGEETYTLEDSRLSYSVITELSFHPNGAVSMANTSVNPGASQYWYKQTITFDENNYPLQRTSHRMPYEDLQATIKKPKVWNRERKVWE